jgi:hypothetical protein
MGDKQSGVMGYVDDALQGRRHGRHMDCAGPGGLFVADPTWVACS